jgi:hypothetical protein
MQTKVRIFASPPECDRPRPQQGETSRAMRICPSFAAMTLLRTGRAHCSESGPSPRVRMKFRDLNPLLPYATLVAIVICASLLTNLCRAADHSTNSPMTAPKGAETPQKLIKQIADDCRSGDSTNLLSCFDTSTRVHEIGAKTFAVSIELAKAKMEVRDALIKKFGATKVAKLTGTYAMPPGLDPLKKIGDSFQNPIVKVEGDTALVNFDDPSEIPLKLERKDGRWLMVRELEGMAAADVDEASEQMESNRYYTLGLHDALKLIPDTKTIEEADKKIMEAVDRQVGSFLVQPSVPPNK